VSKRAVYPIIVVVALAALLAAGLTKTSAEPRAVAEVSVGGADIGGVVASSKGPEAGVWVIAETTDLPTKYVKIVVTDDSGRYLIPGLPKANYKVWVRGYGLVDSQPVPSAPGKTVNLRAVIAPSPRDAAQYYPSDYWFSLLPIPPKSDFPGTGPSGNGISPTLKDQGQWIDMVKVKTCESCHQFGDKATRELPPNLGHFDSSVDAWSRRLASGQMGAGMSGAITRFGRDRALKMYADWTDSIAAGEYPKEAPPRPQGIERNVVITEWDWGIPKEYFHDEITTDRRNIAMNANGLVYGVHEDSTDSLTVLDPNRNSMTEIPVPVHEGTPYSASQDIAEPSPYWGNERIWTSKASVHSLMMDAKGRVWMAAANRERANPAFCKKGSSNLSAQLFPLDQSDRQSTMYDPETRKFTMINLCFSTQHLMFAEDADSTLWFSNPDGGVIGWLDTKKFDETHDEAKSQGWTPIVIDTNGNGKRDAYVEPDQPLDPTKDKRLRTGFIYAINPSPVDGSIWATELGFPGRLIRLNLGSNPPATTLAEIYEPPWNNPKAPVQGYGIRGGDIDRNGVYWTVLTSGHVASFDRRKCKGPLNGPTAATGQQCPEGWTLYPIPGPTFKGTSVQADGNYYEWVDQYDTLGMGKNVPIATGDGSDSLLALTTSTGKFTTLRVPYPLGFYAKSLDGRIDDPNAGWKGKGIWSTYATRAPQHIEGGKGTTSKVVKFQLRPDPLAK
jgi:hypothetical protein